MKSLSMTDNGIRTMTDKK